MKFSISSAIAYECTQMSKIVVAMLVLLIVGLSPLAHGYRDSEHLLIYVINDTTDDLTGHIVYNKQQPTWKETLWTVPSGKTVIIMDCYMGGSNPGAFVGITFEGTPNMNPFYLHANACIFEDMEIIMTGITDFWLNTGVSFKTRLIEKTAPKGGTAPWTRTLSFSSFGAAKGPGVYNLIVESDRGASSHLKIVVAEIKPRLDLISTLEGQ